MLTQDDLKSKLSYDPETGKFTWRKGRGIVKPGGRAGRIHNSGYVEIMIDCKAYRGHRLAWLYMHGQFPEQGIDHINGDKADNRMSNLRTATPSENSQNKTVYKQNKSGFIGVSQIRNSGKYAAQIYVSGTRKYLGVYETAELAFEAYKEAKRQLHRFNPEVPLRGCKGVQQ